jgi:tetratricopeptide (TPR) repeat protein
MKLSLHLPHDSRTVSALASRLGWSTDRNGHPPDASSSLIAKSQSTPAIAALPPWYKEARRHIVRHAWGHAQRALEQAPPDEPDHPAKLDLVSVRRIRRAIRRTSRWPSDVDAHLDLGQAYFDLDLPDEALTEFTIVQRLAPERHEGYVLAALEYVYRGQYAQAATVWLRARSANPDLPDLEEFLGSLPTK